MSLERALNIISLYRKDSQYDPIIIEHAKTIAWTDGTNNEISVFGDIYANVGYALLDQLFGSVYFKPMFMSAITHGLQADHFLITRCLKLHVEDEIVILLIRTCKNLLKLCKDMNERADGQTRIVFNRLLNKVKEDLETTIAETNAILAHHSGDEISIMKEKIAEQEKIISSQKEKIGNLESTLKDIKDKLLELNQLCYLQQ